MTEFDIWKSNITQDIRVLKERVSLLENENESFRNRRNPKSEFLIDKPGFDGKVHQSEDIFVEAGCKQRWINHLIHDRSSRGQLILLLIFTALFIYVGVKEFERAKQNVDTEFKPEKKQYVKDYQDSISTEQYTMPYFFFELFAGNVSADDVNISDYLSKLLDSQNHFIGSATIVYDSPVEESKDDTFEALQVDEAVVITNESGWSENGFWFMFRVKYADPDPSKGSWYLAIRLLSEKLTLNGTLTIEPYYFSITRERVSFKNLHGIYLSKHEESKVTFSIVSYEERVTDKQNRNTRTEELSFTGKPLEFWDVKELDMHLNITADLGETVLLIIPDLQVEYWEEYVDYGYSDWLMAMGGMLSIVSTIFFWMAYYVGKFLDDGVSRVGILGEMSFLYSNFGNIRWIKQTINQKLILLPARKEIAVEFADRKEKTF